MARYSHGALPIVTSIVLVSQIIAAVAADIQMKIEGAPSAKESSIFVKTNDPSLALNRFTFEGNVLPVPGSGKYNVENWVVVYCLDWFEPCRDLAPMWSTLSSEWQGRLNNGWITHKVRFARVDCAVDKVLCNERNVHGYPTIQHFHQGKVASSIQGFRSANDMKTRLTKWLTKNLAPEDLVKPEEPPTVDGKWNKGYIEGNVLTWPSGTSDTLTNKNAQGFSIVQDGQTIKAWLENGKLHWSDGDIWTRQEGKSLGNAAKGGLTVLLALGATSLTIYLAGNPEMKEKTAPPTFSDIDLLDESEPIQAPLPASSSSTVTIRSSSSRTLPEDWAAPTCLSMEL